MRKLFAKAQDPISCETHALGAAAALAGRSAVSASGRLDGCGHTGGGGGPVLLSVYGGTVCRQRHLSLLSRHCRQRRSEAGAAEDGPQYDLCADCRQLHALLRGAAAPAQGEPDSA